MNDIVKFEKKNNKEENIYKNHLVWFKLLVNQLWSWAYKKTVGGTEDRIMSIFKTKDYSQPKLVKTVHGGRKKPRKLKIQELYEDNIIKSIRNLFNLIKENEAIKVK